MGYLGYKPADKPLTSADITDSIITSAKITDATIVNGDIANSTIALAKLSATGTPSAATFLRGDNSWNTPAAGSFVFLGETTASNVATVDLNGYFTSDYDYYKIFMDGVYGSSNDQAVYIRYATTGSYTVDTGSNYMSASGYQAGFGFSYDYFNTTSYARLTYNGSSTSSNTSNFDFTLFNPLGTNNYKTMTCSWQSSSGDITQYVQGHAALGYKSTTAITGIRFYYSAGNIYARKIKIYGVKNS